MRIGYTYTRMMSSELEESKHLLAEDNLELQQVNLEQGGSRVPKDSGDNI